MTTSHPALRMRLTPMLRADLPACVRIALGTRDPWSEESLTHVLRQRDVLGLSAHVDGRLVGFTLYRLGEHIIGCVDLVVDPSWRRRGVGTAILDNLASKLAVHRKQVAVVQVRESNLGAQLFLKRSGWTAERIRERWFCDSEAAYEFAWRAGNGG